jgi:predicted DNA-binding transcriptional regulator AlpA
MSSNKKKTKQSRRAIGWDGLRELGVPYGKNHLRRLWDTGRFPKPFNLSKRTIAWWADDVEEWLASKSKMEAA